MGLNELLLLDASGGKNILIKRENEELILEQAKGRSK